MSDWNPRPMYASQILVDPSDDQRIYMENAFSWSDDGGKTFKVPSPVDPLRRSPFVGQPERLAPSHQSE